MDLQKIYTDSDFSSAIVPDGQLLLFNAIEDGKPVTRYKDSNGNFGTLSGNGGGTTVLLGQVNEDGNFQALAFNGTEASNSGDPETVEDYYTYNGVLPVPESGGGGSSDFYQCDAVFGPSKVSGFVVSGAGTAAVNGNYIPTDLTTEEGSPVYKHETSEYYYFEMWGEKGICTSPTQYPSDGLYYNMYDEGWTIANGGTEPAPTVAAGNIVINADVPKTWNGYKAIWSDKEGYAFEETVTEGLTYGSALNPKPGGIYDGNARMEVSNLFEATKPITTNDTACLIYIDGTTLANQALAPTKHEVTFGSGVTAQDGYLNITNDSSGQILTTAKTDGFGGSLKEWTWDFYFMSDAGYLDCSGHSGYGWVIEGGPGNSLYFRGQNADGKKLGVTFTQNELVGLSMQYDDGVLHVWNKGIYVGTCTPTFPNCDGTQFGIGCIADGDFDRMADKLKFFRFSNKARYTPGVDFELPEGFVE
jgi:hypothetical protein